jgi:RNA polymerase sigma-70 factor (ECF subfamily)
MLLYLQMLETPEEKSLFEQIYLEYRGLMYHVAYEILHNDQDAEDAVPGYQSGGYVAIIARK